MTGIPFLGPEARKEKLTMDLKQKASWRVLDGARKRVPDDKLSFVHVRGSRFNARDAGLSLAFASVHTLRVRPA